MCYDDREAGSMKNPIRRELETITKIILATVPTEKIYLFGSYAYGTPRDDSDVDIYVVLKDDAPFRELEAGQMIDHALYGKRTMTTDLIVKKQAGFAYRQGAPTLEREVAQKGVLLYG
jgi:predicted nucleotidyltransferase